MAMLAWPCIVRCPVHALVCLTIGPVACLHHLLTPEPQAWSLQIQPECVASTAMLIGQSSVRSLSFQVLPPGTQRAAHRSADRDSY